MIRRTKSTRHLEIFSEEEMDLYTVEELIALERDGFKRIPDEIFKNFLDHSYQHITRIYDEKN